MEVLILAHTTQVKLIKRACQVLAAGGLVIFPTETTYGAGVDATNPQAVEKLLAYKSRREGKPLSIAVPDQATAEQYVELTDQARVLYQQFLPGPLTVISQSKGVVAPGVASEFGTVGVRIPDYPLLLELLRQYGKPITATSANGSGKKRPYSLPDILSEISEKQQRLIDLVLDAGVLPPRPPSTVIDTTLSAPVTLRAGDISFASQTTLTLESMSEQETQQLAARLLLAQWDEIKAGGLLLGLHGPLGAGKTVFAQGVAKFLGVTEQLRSPTYTYIEEYPFVRHGFAGTLYHLDMWKVDSQHQYQALEIAQLCRPGCVVVIEWWSQISQWLQPDLRNSGVVLQEIALTDLGLKQRNCTVSSAVKL